MKPSYRRTLKPVPLVTVMVAVLFFAGTNPFAQTKPRLPSRTGYVNDFSGVIDENTRQHLEAILADMKQRSGIELDLVVVETTGEQGIFDFSRQLSREWGVGSQNSTTKSLLLVVSTNEKTMFTQLSKSAQKEMPEGILGELTQRMRAFIAAGQFSESLNDGVQYFVSRISRKMGLSPGEIDKTLAVATPEDPARQPSRDGKALDQPAPIATVPARLSKRRTETATRRTTQRQANTPADDEAEAEEVELTLTLPLAERVVTLGKFLDTHPNSKARPRALELLISAHAALGDQRLKKSDSAGGIEQLMLAIDEAPADMTEKLFSGVISQIPLNLYFRGERAAAFKAAQNIEAKFGRDPNHLLAIAGFYLGIEQGDEAARVAAQAVALAPDLAEAHHALGLGLHISLRLDEAASEYKRALELDPNSKGTRRSLADLSRAAGNAEQALSLYREQLTTEPTDKAARAGLVLSLLDLGRTDEGSQELAAALKDDPRNLALLTGAAYWFAAHNDTEKALQLAQRAVEIEPRYTWSQIALARAMIGQRRPLDAERAIRFARQYGKFPTLDYELASVLSAVGLYDEAAEVLMQSFSFRDGQIQARLAGHVLAHASNFIELLASERRASVFQFTPADSTNNSSMLKALLAFAVVSNQQSDGDKIDEAAVVAAAREFASGDDERHVYRGLYAARRLLRMGIGLQTAYELAEAARNGVEAALSIPAATVAVQADELREIRARAISSGGTPDVPTAPRNVLSNILSGRIEDLSGWALFNQDKSSEAIEHLKRAANILPEGTPLWRTTLWHLGVALDQAGNKEEALAYYIKSYNSGEPDAGRRAVIEQVYQKVTGSLQGLDERIGKAPTTASLSTPSPAVSEVASAATRELVVAKPAAETPTPAASPEQTAAPAVSATSSQAPPPVESALTRSTPSPETTVPSVAESTPTPVSTPSPTSSPETTVASVPVPTPTPEPSPTSSPETTVASVPASTPTPEPSPTSSPETTVASVPTPTPEPSPTPSPETTVASVPASTPTPEPTPAPTPSPTPAGEAVREAASTPEIPGPSPTPSPTDSPEAIPAKTPSPAVVATPEPTPDPISDPSAQRPRVSRATVKLSGMVKDATGKGIANAVVVLISPRGTVIASTTDAEGNYSFAVLRSQLGYRIVPSKVGVSFEPFDRVLGELSDDQKDVDFVAATTRPP